MNIYVCVTYYHLFVALLKNIKIPQTSDLVISSMAYSNNLCTNYRLIEQINNQNIFRKIYVYDLTRFNYLNDKEPSTRLSKRVKYRRWIKKYKEIDFNIYQDIYLFNDETAFGMLLNWRSIHYNLLEDGTDNYLKYQPREDNSIKHKIAKALRLDTPKLATSQLINSIEVNSSEGLLIKGKKIIVRPKRELIDSLNADEKLKIYEIFLGKTLSTNFNDGKYALIISQPLYEDGFLYSEIDKVNIYKYIIQNYCSGYIPVIKLHPRESTEYSSYIQNVITIKKPFPLEILNFNPNIIFSKAITVSSTSIQLIDFVKRDEKIDLGWKWFVEYCKDHNVKINAKLLSNFYIED